MLLINTTGSDSCACIIDYDSHQCSSLPPNQWRAKSLLLTIDTLLIQQRVKLPKLAGIVVVTGPGSFTGTKVGITIANTLAWTMNLPIVGIATDLLDTKYEELIQRIRTSRPQIIRPTLPAPSMTIKK